MKSLNRSYLAKKSFIVPWPIQKLVKRSLIMFLRFRINLKWKNERLAQLILKIWHLLLAEMLEKFRNNNLKNYGLYPNHYFSALALNWDTILNMTKDELELILNPEMLLFFQKGMRGRVSYISNRFSEVNNKYFKSYDLKQESKYIIYLDASNR